MSEFTLDTSGGVLLPVPESKTGTRFAVMWSDLDPFTQGYVEALFASGIAMMADEHLMRCYPGGTRPWSFSDLAPETLAAILKDCADWHGLSLHEVEPTPALQRSDFGAEFWRGRQRGMITPSFPPLTPYLGDDGRVYLREAG